MSALSPSLMFNNLNAIDHNDPTPLHATESVVTKEFTQISNPVEHRDTGFADGHIQTSAVETLQELPQMVSGPN